MDNDFVSNEVLVVINEACSLMECVFRDGVSEHILNWFNAQYRHKPGHSVTYGINMAQGGEDKSVLVVHDNRALDYRTAATELEILLSYSYLGFKNILWKRDIPYGTKKSNVLAEVC